MANPNPIKRNEEQELMRQISFARTHRNKVYEKADAKAAEYDAKIEQLEEKLRRVKSLESV